MLLKLITTDNEQIINLFVVRKRFIFSVFILFSYLVIAALFSIDLYLLPEITCNK